MVIPLLIAFSERNFVMSNFSPDISYRDRILKVCAMRVYYYTHRGKVRHNNEDGLFLKGESLYEVNLERVESMETEPEGLFCVLDGLGGHIGGEVAVKLVLETLKELKPCTTEELSQCLFRARENLEAHVRENPELYGFGCTIAGVCLKGENLHVFNVGDCRVYRIVDSKAIRLSKDHSLVEELVAEGVITREEAHHHPQRHVVTSAVIGDNYQTELRIYATTLELLAGDRILICSDGFWEEAQELWKIAQDPQGYVDRLFTERPLKDNLSFIMLELEA